MPPVESRSSASILKKASWRQAAWLVVGLAALLYGLGLFVPWRPDMPAQGRDLSQWLALLEPSWRDALNVSFDVGLKFGRDVVFPFGPWGFLFSRLYHPSTFVLLIVTWMFLSWMFVWTGWQIARHITRNPLVGFAWLVGLIGVAGAWPDVFFLSLCLLFLVYCLYVHDGSLSVTPLLLCLTLALISLVKFTVLVLAVFLVAVVSLFDLFVRKRFPWAALLYPVALSGFWIAAGQNLGDFWAYLYHSLCIASGYNEAMARVGPREEIGLFVVAGLLSLTLVAASEWRRRHQGGAFSVVGLLAILFMGFKTGFVRHDPWHALIAPFTLLAAMWTYAGVLWGSLPGRARTMGIGLCLASAIALGWFSLDRYMRLSLPTFLARTVQTAQLSLAEIRNLTQGDVHLRRAHAEANARIRAAVPVQAGAGSFDIYPYELAVIFAHGLQWKPRPVIQSYSAYTSTLADLNAGHLRSENAPDSLLFDVATIDGRFPALDDGLSWPEILTRYDIRSAAGPHLFLGRSEVARSYRLVPVQTAMATFDTQLEVPGIAEGPIWARIDVRPTWLGRLVAFLYKPPPVFMTVRAPSIPILKFRLIPAMARAGFLLSPMVQDRATFVALTLPDWTERLRGVAPIDITLSVEPNAQRFFNPDVEVSFFRLDFPRREAPIGKVVGDPAGS